MTIQYIFKEIRIINTLYMFNSVVKNIIPRIYNNYNKELENSPIWINNVGLSLIDNKKIEEDDDNITYFKVNNKKHSNFQIETIEMPFNIKKSDNKYKENEVEKKNINLINMRNKYKKILEDRKINKNKTDIKTAGDGKDINSKNKNGHFVMEKVELQIGGTSIDEKFEDWFGMLEDLKYKRYDDIINSKILIDDAVDKINGNIIEYIQLDNLDKIYNYNNYNDTNIIEI